MTPMMKRLVYALGVMPMAAYSGLRWIVTGEDPEEYFQRFVDWGTK